MASYIAPAGGCARSLFDYNRNNFLEDREQRQVMEYQVMDMRIEQTKMWREDIREIVEFTQTKVEMYLLVSTLLLGFCATAIVKAVVVEGTPSWLACAHTLMLCGAFMFFVISVILGINAYVSSQAYLVRLLTQYVRLPIPSWKAIEASRTYSSTFEKQRCSQMFRTPFATGEQEKHTEDPQHNLSATMARASPPQTPRSASQVVADALPCGGAKAKPGPSGTRKGPVAADPWGLERRGDDLPELHPLVNIQCAKQRHIWLAREAGKYYLTHEAFCRVAMSLGTSYLCLFFSYYCLTYCLVEDGSPQAAFAGMVVFVILSLVVVFLDKVVDSRQMVVLMCMQLVAPMLSAITTYQSMPDGYGGAWEYIVCAGLFMHGAWLLMYLHMLQVRETDTGVFFPMGFKTALILDAFGRHPHPARQPGKLSAPGVHKDDASHDATLPALSFVHGPFRPEDLNCDGKSAPAKPADAWGPETFASLPAEEEEKGNILHGKKPGLQVWLVFRFAVAWLALSWFLGSVFSLRQAIAGQGHFKKVGLSWERKAEWSPIVSVALQMGTKSWRSERLQTSWPSRMARPQGLACDPSGTTFATFGRASGGHRTVLYARYAAEEEEGGAAAVGGYSRSQLAFSPAAPCPGLRLGPGADVAKDMVLHKCADMEGCSALVLPTDGQSLVSCRLEGHIPDIMDDGAAGLGLFQRQAIYRKINRDDTVPNVDRVLSQEALRNKEHQKSADFSAAGFLHNSSVPLARAWLDDIVGEEFSSLSIVACESGEGGPSECPVLGTSAGRFVKMGPGRAGNDGKEAWVPRHVLWEGASPQPGSLADLGSGHLGVLRGDGKTLRVLDGTPGGSTEPWLLRLPKPSKNRQWASVCAGGGSVYALESGEDPAVWRLTQK